MEDDEDAARFSEFLHRQVGTWRVQLEELQEQYPGRPERDVAVFQAVLWAGMEMETLRQMTGRRELPGSRRQNMAWSLAFIFKDEPDMLDEAIRVARSDDPIVRGDLYSDDRALVVLTEAKRIREEMESGT